MSKSYQPPFSVTAKIIHQIAEISESLGRLSVTKESENDLRLRRINRIRTIHGSLAIEGNALTEGQITAILEGRQVIAPIKEITEAKNAIAAYEKLKDWLPTKKQHLLAAHQLLMGGLIDDAGGYRCGNVGVIKGEKVIHMAPPANRVNQLMNDLLAWVKRTQHHPLIVSSVFHYEFEFIHPFNDGNGRIGRLWQTLILSQWNPLLEQLPVESMVYRHQNDYYNAIRQSTKITDSSIFIEFMLAMIIDSIDSQNKSVTPQATPQVTPQVKQLVQQLKNIGAATNRDQLQQRLSLKDRKSFRLLYLNPAIKLGLIELTIPDKPNSSLQKYRLTEKGSKFIG